MNKVKLDVDGLRVETFETSAADGSGRGTVHGHWSQMGTCDGRVATCQVGGTCGAGCGTVKNCTGIYCV